MPAWLQKLAQKITDEYRRRTLRASQISGYNVGHPAQAPAEDEDEAEIVNVPRGKVVAKP